MKSVIPTPAAAASTGRVEMQVSTQITELQSLEEEPGNLT